MSNYSTTSIINLQVNGKQAKQTFNLLEKEAARLQKQIDAAVSGGDKNKASGLQKQLKNIKVQMDQLRGSAATTEQVLQRLDKATPKELTRALRSLQSQLNGIERGSAAWDAHIAKIKAVKDEIRRLNDEMKPDGGFREKLTGYWEKIHIGVTTAAAAVTGLVLASRKAVEAYAEMEQEMANVRKYTGMDDAGVAALNEELKKIDTRTSREELNKLAQEAGRLGKTSQEDVLGFVRAADKINVALDDLGSGATLTLSKLTGIFGDEKRLGTEKALLSVGSVINELSQNCAASAPYLAEFASRLGGVGAQAGMTVQQIMGFAAVLDANNQNVEASSTALSQVIVRIYQDPAKYANVAGLDVKHFAELVKNDMNGALIELLSTLNRAGKMDVLSPMFKDMGEKGSRAISTLSTLANHIDEVRSQQIVANEAFEQAISIDKEFDVQNNTVQAGLEKAKNRLHELTVELGEKLQPVIKYVYSSSSALLKLLNMTVDFFIKYKTEIIAISATFVAYRAILVAKTIATKADIAATTAQVALNKALAGGIPALTLAYTAMRNALSYVANGLQVTYTMQERWRKSMAAMNTGSWVGLILTAATALFLFVKRLRDEAKAAEEAKAAHEKWVKSLTDAKAKMEDSDKQEMARLKRIYDATQNVNKSYGERAIAAKALLKLYPEVFKNFNEETILAGNAKKAYDELTKSIQEASMARAAQSLMDENSIEIIKLESELEELNRTRSRKQGAVSSMQWRKEETDSRLGAFRILNNESKELREGKKELAELDSRIDATTEKLTQLRKANESLEGKFGRIINEKTVSTDPEPGQIEDTDTETESGKKSKDKFAAEKEWREKAEALARIDYATGKTDYIKYTEEMDRIAVEFYQRQLLHTDLTEGERLKITAQWHEAQLKQQEHFSANSIEEEEKRYSEELAQLKQFYIDGAISKETYTAKMEEVEIKHQRKLISVTKEGTKERLRAEQQLQSLLIAQTQRRQQEREKLEAKYASMKKDYFGDNPQEAQAKYNDDMAILQVVYDRELEAAGHNAQEKLRIEEAFEKAKLVLKKKYGLMAEDDTRNAMEKGVAKSVEWLNSDGGKALTGTLNTLVSGMSSIFSQLSSGIQAELEIQTAAINKRYEAEISNAEGNAYKIKKLEKQKEAEIAKVKKEANRKMFAMQVIQAVAQTATNALNAYGSAAAVPVVGYILAPIAAAMAVAAGAVQIATIKKQQQASESQGYSEGGFTKPGKKEEVAGVVHAGEWVASKALVDSPKTRPLINMLERAQRSNTIGSLSMQTVASYIVPAGGGAGGGGSAPAPQVVVVEQQQQIAGLIEVVSRLERRLSDPFVTINTMEGDYGINEVTEEYKRLTNRAKPR